MWTQSLNKKQKTQNDSNNNDSETCSFPSPQPFLMDPRVQFVYVPDALVLIIFAFLQDWNALLRFLIACKTIYYFRYNEQDTENIKNHYVRLFLKLLPPLLLKNAFSIRPIDTDADTDSNTNSNSNNTNHPVTTTTTTTITTTKTFQVFRLAVNADRIQEVPQYVIDVCDRLIVSTTLLAGCSQHNKQLMYLGQRFPNIKSLILTNPQFYSDAKFNIYTVYQQLPPQLTMDHLETLILHNMRHDTLQFCRFGDSIGSEHGGYNLGEKKENLLPSLRNLALDHVLSEYFISYFRRASPNLCQLSLSNMPTPYFDNKCLGWTIPCHKQRVPTVLSTFKCLNNDLETLYLPASLVRNIPQNIQSINVGIFTLLQFIKKLVIYDVERNTATATLYTITDKQNLFTYARSSVFNPATLIIELVQINCCMQQNDGTGTCTRSCYDLTHTDVDKFRFATLATERRYLQVHGYHCQSCISHYSFTSSNIPTMNRNKTYKSNSHDNNNNNNNNNNKTVIGNKEDFPNLKCRCGQHQFQPMHQPGQHSILHY